jgi:hypothetical protein
MGRWHFLLTLEILCGYLSQTALIPRGEALRPQGMAGIATNPRSPHLDSRHFILESCELPSHWLKTAE